MVRWASLAATGEFSIETVSLLLILGGARLRRRTTEKARSITAAALSLSGSRQVLKQADGKADTP